MTIKRTRIFNKRTAPATWNAAPGYNFLFLTRASCELNDRLRYERFISLKECLETLGLKSKSSADAILGYKYEEGVNFEIRARKGHDKEYIVTFEVRPIYLK